MQSQRLPLGTKQHMISGLLMMLLVVVSLSSPVLASALDDYAAAPDPAYAWKAAPAAPLPGGAMLYQLSLTSQKWHGTTWHHRLSVVMPPTPKYKTALLYITGSGSGVEEITLMTKLATQLSAPVAALFDIPNQPLFGNLREDNLISYTFTKFVESQDSTWPLLLPMVKGAVRAMDALTEFSIRNLGIKVDGFVVFGGSKRGWTTWLTAAVDKRVKAIAPIAYDNLDLVQQMAYQQTSFGGFSEQINEYTDRGLQSILSTQLGKTLVGIVDPYAYRDRYDIPKLIIRGSNDPYWPVDAVQLYLRDLPGTTWIHYDPNGGHDLRNIDRVMATLGGFYLHVVGAQPLIPIRSETKEAGNTVTLQVQSSLPAVNINLWYASSVTTDFRKSVWSTSTGAPGLSYGFTISRPSNGYKAVYGEVSYQVGDTTLCFDTPVYIVGPLQ